MLMFVLICVCNAIDKQVVGTKSQDRSLDEVGVVLLWGEEKVGEDRGGAFVKYPSLGGNVGIGKRELKRSLM
jgi:hypothetical protein